FFFQAEDGIRDRNVTGVQTCALPIYSTPSMGKRAAASKAANVFSGCVPDAPRCAYISIHARSLSFCFFFTLVFRFIGNFHCPIRSEERRVGKEWCSCISWEH